MAFFNISYPAANGVGASVDISAQPEPLVVLPFLNPDESITLEQSMDNVNFTTLQAVRGNQAAFPIVPGNFIRARRTQSGSGAGNLQALGLPSTGTVSTQSPTVPTSTSTPGAAIDISAQPNTLAIQFNSTPDDGVVAQVSLDSTNYANLVAVAGGTTVVTPCGCIKLRLARSPNQNPGASPNCKVWGDLNASGGGGGGGGFNQNTPFKASGNNAVEATSLAVRVGHTVNIVDDFGAVGDGATDNTAKFAAAIASMPNGGVIEVPHGIFKGNIVVNVNNISIRGIAPQLFNDGSSAGSKLIPFDPTKPCLSVGDGIASVTACFIDDIYLVGDSVTANSDGFVVNGASQVFVNGLHVSNFGRHNINITSTVAQITSYIYFTNLISVNYGCAGAGAGFNIDYGGSFVGALYVDQFNFIDGANRGPNCHSIQINDFVSAFFNNGFISCSGAAAGDPNARTGSVHISGTASNGTHLFFNNVTIDSPAGGSIDELVVIDSAFQSITNWISGNWTCDGIAVYTTDNTILDIRNTYGGNSERWSNLNREFTSNGPPVSGVNPSNVGDRIWNQAPVSGGSDGWICTTAGAFANSGAWAPLTPYTRGDATTAPQSVTNDGGKIYWCTVTGTSAGAGGPTGTGLDIVDGTCHWRFIAAGAPVYERFGPIESGGFGFETIVDEQKLPANAVDGAGLIAYTPPVDSVLEIGGYINCTIFAAGTCQIQLTYTDVHGTFQAIGALPGTNGGGAILYSTGAGTNTLQLLTNTIVAKAGSPVSLIARVGAGDTADFYAFVKKVANA